MNIPCDQTLIWIHRSPLKLTASSTCTVRRSAIFWLYVTFRIFIILWVDFLNLPSSSMHITEKSTGWIQVFTAKLNLRGKELFGKNFNFCLTIQSRFQHFTLFDIFSEKAQKRSVKVKSVNCSSNVCTNYWLYLERVNDIQGFPTSHIDQGSHCRFARLCFRAPCMRLTTVRLV